MIPSKMNVTQHSSNLQDLRRTPHGEQCALHRYSNAALGGEHLCCEGQSGEPDRS